MTEREGKATKQIDIPIKDQRIQLVDRCWEDTKHYYEKGIVLNTLHVLSRGRKSSINKCLKKRKLNFKGSLTFAGQATELLSEGSSLLAHTSWSSMNTAENLSVAGSVTHSIWGLCPSTNSNNTCSSEWMEGQLWPIDHSWMHSSSIRLLFKWHTGLMSCIIIAIYTHRTIHTQ